MKIKMTTSAAGIDFSYGQDEVVDVDDELATDLLNAGYAEAVEDKPSKRNTRTTLKPETRTE